MTIAPQRPVNGHPVDVETLYREQRDRIIRHATKASGDSNLAEDAVQEAFADMLAKGRTSRNPGAYLAVAARNQAFNVLRDRGRESPSEAVERAADSDTSGTGMDACMGDPRIAAKVAEALALLTPEQRFAVEAHCLQGRRVSEIAKELGLHHSSIYQRINGGLAKLRAAGIALPDLDDEPAAQPRPALSPTVQRGVDVLRAEYGDKPPADLPGPSELSRRHGWDTKKASAARAAYTGVLVRPGRKVTAAKPAAKTRKPIKKTTTERAATVTPAPVPTVTPAPAAPSVAEAWLSTSGTDVTCMFVNSDESTRKHPAVFRSMAGAQREITGHLVADGYRPTSPWTEQGPDESMRTFNKEEVRP